MSTRPEKHDLYEFNERAEENIIKKQKHKQESVKKCVKLFDKYTNKIFSKMHFYLSNMPPILNTPDNRFMLGKVAILALLDAFKGDAEWIEGKPFDLVFSDININASVKAKTSGFFFPKKKNTTNGRYGSNVIIKNCNGSKSEQIDKSESAIVLLKEWDIILFVQSQEFNPNSKNDKQRNLSIGFTTYEEIKDSLKKKSSQITWKIDTTKLLWHKECIRFLPKNSLDNNDYAAEQLNECIRNIRDSGSVKEDDINIEDCDIVDKLTWRRE